MGLRTSDFDYELPRDRIAQRPLARRDESRLMVLDRRRGSVEHAVFKELPGLLRPGDLLVVNDTRVIPARFGLRRRTGGRIEGLFLRELSTGQWEVMLKGAGRCKVGEELAFPADAGLVGRLERRADPQVWHLAVSPPAEARAILDRIGRTPLPPYIRRPGPVADEQDRRAYQTVYASRPGAVAAPTAGLHFTEGLLRALRAEKVGVARVTLHVGLGTFAPVKAGLIERYRMHAEYYRLGPAAAKAAAQAKRQGRRIVAVGTTSVRVLEAAGAAGPIGPREGWTDLFLYPPAEFRVVDALVTNFHLPRSTLLMLAAAFCSPGKTDGVGMILDAYRQAIEKGYRFYSYGDAMLIV